jgi:hypothetical protein
MEYKDAEGYKYCVIPRHSLESTGSRRGLSLLLGYCVIQRNAKGMAWAEKDMTSCKPTREEATKDLVEYAVQNNLVEVTRVVYTVLNGAQYEIESNEIPVPGQIVSLNLENSEPKEYMVLSVPESMPTIDTDIDNYDEEISYPLIYITPWIKEPKCNQDCPYYSDDEDTDERGDSCEIDDHIIYESEGCFVTVVKTNRYNESCPLKSFYEERVCALLGITPEQLNKVKGL